jgi:hypothetical protein
MLDKVRISICHWPIQLSYQQRDSELFPEIKIIAGNPNKFKQALRKISEYTLIFYIGGILQYLIYKCTNLTTVFLKVCWHLEFKIILNCFNVH